MRSIYLRDVSGVEVAIGITGRVCLKEIRFTFLSPMMQYSKGTALMKESIAVDMLGPWLFLRESMETGTV